MSVTLRSLQTNFRRFIADNDPSVLLGSIDAHAARGADRLGIFRNNSLVAHTTALSAVFPVVRRLVDARFFAFMAHEFLREYPPRHPCLSQFGEDFPRFVAQFAPAGQILYLSDVARLEWAISRAPAVREAQPIPLARLVARSGDPSSLRLTFASAVSFIDSEYPIDLVWELNQSADLIEDVALETQGAHLQVRGGGWPPWRRLTRANWTFRSAAAGGATLGVATEKALEIDSGFDLADALTGLFSEGLVLGCARGRGT